MSSHSSDSALRAARLHGSHPVTEQADRSRAKRVGGKFLAASYPAARAVVAHILHRSMSENGVSEARFAEAAGVSRSLVHQWIDPQGCNSLRLDLALVVAAHGGQSGRNLVVQALREVLAAVETAASLDG